MKSICDIPYGEHPRQALDVHLPECGSFPVMLYFHGGGLERGNKTKQQVFFNYMTGCGIAVVSANYRMYPDARYPDFVDDAAAAAAWVYRHMGEYGNIEGIYIGGSSAGGFLSQLLCFDAGRLGAHGLSAMDFAGFIHDAGQPTCHFNVLRERGIDSRRVIIDESAPLYHVGADAQYPPMLVIVSDNDMENRYEQTMLLLSTLRHFGHEGCAKLVVMHGGHCAYVNAVDDAGESVFGKVCREFIQNS